MCCWKHSGDAAAAVCANLSAKTSNSSYGHAFTRDLNNASFSGGSFERMCSREIRPSSDMVSAKV